MSDAAVIAEEAIAEMVGAVYSGSTPTVTASSPEVLLEEVKYEFDDEFQLKIATHVLRDQSFMMKAAHLVKPEYFENVGVQAMVNLGLRYFQKRNAVVQTRVVGKELFKDDVDNKIIRSDTKQMAIDTFKAIFSDSADLSNGDLIADKVAEFARHQAVSNAIYGAATLLDKKQFDKIEAMITAAMKVGINVDSNEYDYWERAEERRQTRIERLTGVAKPTGITTGHKMIDDLLFHRGWGRKELNVILGGAKSGKTTALINFSKAAVLAGLHVLHVSLEVSSEINAMRADATMTDTFVKELEREANTVKGKLDVLRGRAGEYKIHEYPSGTFSPNQLRQLIERYKTPSRNPDGTIRKAVKFDLIVVDYADIMAPDFRTNDPIENSKNIYLGLRAIASEENVAMLTATQGNREGAKATVLTGVHVADDYNKVRTVDLMISINVTDEERANGEARLHFAASRNQEGGITIFVKQELSKMKFISSILRIE